MAKQPRQRRNYWLAIGSESTPTHPPDVSFRR